MGYCRTLRLLGKGKSGYSYTAKLRGNPVVLKLLHDEPCSYYQFGDKLEAELAAYEALREAGIRVPKLLCHETAQPLLVKQYIRGRTATELIAAGDLEETILQQLYRFSRLASNAGWNLDYFPANFVVENGRLWYIDYEVNPYDEAWDLRRWGIYYWLNREGMRRFLDTGDAGRLNESLSCGLPVKKPFEQPAEQVMNGLEEWYNGS